MHDESMYMYRIKVNGQKLNIRARSIEDSMIIGKDLYKAKFRSPEAASLNEPVLVSMAIFLYPIDNEQGFKEEQLPEPDVDDEPRVYREDGSEIGPDESE